MICVFIIFRYDRRSFTRDTERSIDTSKDSLQNHASSSSNQSSMNQSNNNNNNSNNNSSRSSRNTRYNNYNNQYDRRRYNNDRDEEPEWFSGGPTSQNDTIELRGFDDPYESNEISASPPLPSSSTNTTSVNKRDRQQHGTKMYNKQHVQQENRKELIEYMMSNESDNDENAAQIRQKQQHQKKQHIKDKDNKTTSTDEKTNKINNDKVESSSKDDKDNKSGGENTIQDDKQPAQSQENLDFNFEEFFKIDSLLEVSVFFFFCKRSLFDQTNMFLI